MHPPPNRTPALALSASKATRGFSLIELAVVLAILGLIVGIGLQALAAYISTEARKVTTARLSGVDAAMVNFVAQQRRLPCPANGTIATGAANAGVEQRNAGNGTCLPAAIQTGVVPWVTLGLSESDSTDGWNNRLTYRTISATVGAGNVGFTSNQALDMTNCDPSAGAAMVSRTFAGQPVMTCVANAVGICDLNAVATCTAPANFVLNRGVGVQDGLGNWLMNPAIGTGAAYVLISHGDSATGAYNNAGVIQAGSIPASLAEIQNRNNAVMQPFYMDARFIDGNVPAHFDDMLSRPSLMSLITKAQLGPRAHLQ